MIIYYFLKAIGTGISAFFMWLPRIDSLPFGLDEILSYLVSLFHGAMETLPYLQVVWTCFLWILVFELTMLVVKLILGSRTPTHNIN